MRGKEFRRRQAARAKARAVRFLAMLGIPPSNKQIHLYAENRVPCSCYLCRDEKYRDTRDKRVD
jgi:hypothetical protein